MDIRDRIEHGRERMVNFVGEERISRWRKFVPAALFASGFVFDIVTLGRIDSISTMAGHGLYLAAAVFILASLFVKPEGWQPERPWLARIVALRQEGLHFFLGGLLNAFVIFYFKSGTLANSFLLLFLLVLLLLANETSFFRSRGLALKSTLVMINLVSFFLYLLPVLVGGRGGWLFVASLGLAILVFTLMGAALAGSGVAIADVSAWLYVPGCLVVCAFVLFYALRILPPLPLSARYIGVYHKVERDGGSYILHRQTPLWHFWVHGDVDFAAAPGDRIYVFARIFAPRGFSERVFLRFQRWGTGKWLTSDRIGMGVSGGRDLGWRGYAYKKNYRPGDWRVLLETPDGLEIGRLNFRVRKVAANGISEDYVEVH